MKLDIAEYLGSEKLDLLRRYFKDKDNVDTPEGFEEMLLTCVKSSIDDYVSDAEEHFRFEEEWEKKESERIRLLTESKSDNIEPINEENLDDDSYSTTEES